MPIKWTSIIDGYYVVSTISISIYAYVLNVIISSKSKAVHSAFFHIFTVTGVFDIMGVIAYNWVRLDVNFCFGPSFELISRLAAAMTGTNSLTHMIGSLLMTLNRFTAVLYPDKHGDIWRKRNVCIILAVDVITSYLVYIPLYSNKMHYDQRDDRWCCDGREEPVNELRIISATIVFFYEFISIILIMKTICGMNKALHVNAFKHSQNMRLLVVTAISCLLSVFELIYEFSSLSIMEYVINHKLDWFLKQYDKYFLLFMTINAYSIVLLSKAVRHELAQRWHRRLPYWDFPKVAVF
ncbi:hypothetical protein KIN20_003527 [Parelaphostrongylus tenuis]|uniref:Serpentine receptor class gamma n=1 Tax=Parelaphostrongylus tenuis TaxID=148309 RepID=A0AAD5QIN5_PARTN|nr:hypothetical protein KIN20_003527 [Parelaphostrongylus tenuis]